MKKQWQRGTCAKCGKPGYLYEGTDMAWVHDKLEYPLHQFVLETVVTDYSPDENHVADERNDQVRVDSEPEDSFSYGGLDHWTPWEGAF